MFIGLAWGPIVTRYVFLAMRAYKFLDAQGRAPFTLTPWKLGEWVETNTVEPCHSGVHACRTADLSYWLAPTLWEVELAGPIIETRHKLTASRGRLVAEVSGYHGAVIELGEWCAWRARDRALSALRAAGSQDLADRFQSVATLQQLIALGGDLDDSTSIGTAAALAVDTAHFADGGPITEAPFIGACSAGHAAAGLDGDQVVFDAAYAQERALQSAWLIDRLGLFAS